MLFSFIRPAPKTSPTRIGKFQVSDSKRNNLEIFPPKLGWHGKFLPAPPTSPFAMLRQWWWMMRDLLRNYLNSNQWEQTERVVTWAVSYLPSQVFSAITLVSFSQERIKRFSRPNARGGIRGDSEGRNIRQLFTWVCTLSCFVQ